MKTQQKKSKKIPGLWTMAFRNIRRQPRRSFMSALAIGIAALTMVLMFSLIAGMKYDMAESIQRYYTGQVLVQHRNYERSSVNTLGLFIPGVSGLGARMEESLAVEKAAPRVASAASVFLEGDTVFFPFLGLDFDKDPARLADSLLPGGKLPERGARQALVSGGLAEKLNLKVGDEITAVTQTLRGASNGMSFEITGIVRTELSQFNAPYLFTSLETAQRFVKLGDAATSLLVTSKAGVDKQVLLEEVRRALARQKLDQIQAHLWADTSTGYSLLAVTQVIYGFIALFFFALASTVIVNTMLMVVLERGKEIGTLAALGMEPARIQRLFLAESALLSGFGALLGTLAGCLLAVVLNRTGIDLTESMQGVDFEMSGIIRPVLEVGNPLIVLAGAVGVASLFTFLPTRKVTKVNITEALRGTR